MPLEYKAGDRVTCELLSKYMYEAKRALCQKSCQRNEFNFCKRSIITNNLSGLNPTRFTSMGDEISLHYCNSNT